MAQERRHDVVVAGAGIIGLACAWRAARAGMSVLVLERGEARRGAASAVAAGMLAPATEAAFGEDALLRLNLAGRAEWPAFAAELAERSGIDLEFSETGALVVAVERDDVGELRRLNELQRSLGLEADWLTGRECRRLEPGLSPRVSGGVLAQRDGSVDPRAVVRALRTVLAGEGVEVRHGVEVLRVEEDAGRVTGLATSDGRLAAERVVVACGAWSGDLHESAPALRPVKGQIVRLRGAPLADRIVRTPRCYVVSRAGGEIVVGATSEERGFDTTVTAGAAQRLLEYAWEVLPDVEERELVSVEAGLRPMTRDGLPAVRAAGPEGLVWATGHGRNGVLLAPLAARTAVELLAGRRAPAVGSAT